MHSPGTYELVATRAIDAITGDCIQTSCLSGLLVACLVLATDKRLTKGADISAIASRQIQLSVGAGD